MNTVVIIPAYNAENTIGELVSRSYKFVQSVIVVDNNSTDGTVGMATKQGAIVYRETRQGQGAATRNAWHVIASSNTHDVMITMDSDAQHNPDEIPRLLWVLAIGRADIVIGSRFITKYNAPRYRKFGIDVINWLYNVGHNNKLADTQCCFRVYNRKALVDLRIEEDGFGFSTELLIKARKQGLRIVETPTACIYHNDRKMNSTLNPLLHGMIVAWKTVLWRIKLLN